MLDLKLASRLTRYRIRMSPIYVALIAVLVACHVVAALIPVTYERTIVASELVANGGSRYAIDAGSSDVAERLKATGRFRHIEIQRAQLRSAEGAVLGIARLSDDVADGESFGVTEQRAPDRSPALALSIGAARQLLVGLGAEVEVTLPDGRTISRPVTRLFDLPAEPDVAYAAVLAEPSGAATTFTSTENPTTVLGDMGITTAHVSDVDFRIEQRLRESSAPRVVDVARQARWLIWALAIGSVVALTVSGRSSDRTRRLALHDAGLSQFRARRLSALSRGGAVIVATAAGSVLGVGVWSISAGRLGDSAGQYWPFGSTVAALTSVPVLATYGLIACVLGVTAIVGGCFRTVSVRSPTLTASLVVLGPVTFTVGFLGLVYLAVTAGPAAGWFVIAWISPVLTALGIFSLALVAVRYVGSGATRALRAASAGSVASVSGLVLLLVTVTAYPIGYLISSSVYGVRANPISIVGGVLEFTRVPTASVNAMAELAADSGLGFVSITEPLPTNGVVRGVPPAVAECAMTSDAADARSAISECSRRADWSDPYKLAGNIAAIDTRSATAAVTAAPDLVRDGRVGAIAEDAQGKIVDVKVLDAAPDSGLGSAYISPLLLPESNELVRETGLRASGFSAVKYSGVAVIDPVDYSRVLGAALALSPSATLFEDFGYDDQGSYFAGTLVAMLASGTGLALVLVLRHDWRLSQRSWRDLLHDLRLPMKARFLLIVAAIGPIAAGMSVGVLASAAAVSWSVDDAPLWESRLLFALPAISCLMALWMIVAEAARVPARRY